MALHLVIALAVSHALSLVTVCDELLLGIPYQAWWVVVMVVLCLILALIIPAYLPPDWLAKNQRLWSFNLNAPKDS